VRIAVVAPLTAPLLTADVHGSHAVVVDVARGLAERGHAVLVVCAEGSNVPDLPLATVPSTPGRRSRLLPGIAPRVLEKPMRDTYERAFSMVRAHQPDAVTQHAFDADAIQLAEGLPVIHTLHRPPHVDPVIEALRRSASPTFAVSETSGHDWVRADVGPIGILPNGVPDLVRWPRGVGQRHAIEPDAVLIAGRIAPEKGTAESIRAALAAGLRPLVVGAVQDEDYFRSEVAPLLPADEVVRPVTRPALAAMMGRVAATVVATGTDDPFSLLAAEAQTAGCPVVAYRRGALPEIVEDGVTGILVEPGAEAALAAALRVVGRLDRRRIRSLALERFPLDGMVDAYEAELGRVAEAARTGAASPIPLRQAG
jgi:glycosyltransferase involved in cell wall biosynthesis